MKFPVLALLMSSAFAADPIRYTLRFPAPQTHYVEVEAMVPATQPDTDLLMAVWTPGSYLVRDYARHVEALTVSAPDGRALAVTKTAKNRWRVASAGATALRVRYRVYSREMSVRTNWVESRFALLNGAPTFLTLAGSAARPHEVRLELPADWKTSATGLPPASDQPHHYVAADFDTLVDSPLLAGNPAVHTFTVDGKRHRLVNEGEGGVWDGPRSARDTERIVQEYRRMWGSLPYDQYAFLNLLVEAGGGLEHKNSTVLMASRWATRKRESYLRWLELVSHEFFHVWNVKRLRPAELGPFDYERENYTRSLWVSEGFTTYYGDLAVRRAGLMTTDEYLAALSRTVEELQSTPGRLVLPAEQSSFDAWIKQYRPDENSPNSAISYYTKGAVIGFLLDARIRRATNGARSLDDLMRLAYERHSGERGFTPEQFRQAASEVAGTDLSDWLRRALETTEDLDYSEAIAWFGLRQKPEKAPEPGVEPKAFLGATTKVDGGRLVVSQVRRGTPAYAAGLNVDDELLAIDDYRVRPDGLASRLEAYRPNDGATLLVARRDQLVRLPITFGKEPVKVRYEADPAANAEQKAHLQSWLQPAS